MLKLKGYSINNYSINCTNSMHVYILDTRVTFRSYYQLSLTQKWNKTSGIVSIYDTINGINAMVCGYNWNMNNADVVCRQMGYLGALERNCMPVYILLVYKFR